METIQIQALFFNHIKSKLPAHLSFVDEVAEALQISNDSAYRRIRGEKPLGMNEIQILCNKYHISLDRLLHIQTNTVIFSGNKVDSVSFGFNAYLQDVLNNLEQFKQLPTPEMFYYNKDVPLFHFMQFPELRAFKFFFWKRTLMGYPELAKQQFKGNEADEVTSDLATKIISLYSQIPSTEIWNEENVHSTIRQIEFYRQSRVFADKEIVLKLYAQLDQMLNHLELQAEAGRKFLNNQPDMPNSAPYDIYINECLIGDNTIFVQSEGRQITCLNHNGLNFTSTTDKSFCAYTYKNLQNIMRKSTHISVVGEKERSMFFNALREKIRERVRHIN